VRYGYNVRAATQQIEGLGYVRSADGGFQASDGSRLSVQIQTHQQNSFHVPTTLSVADTWRRFGIEVQTDVLSTAQSLDAKYRAQHPAFLLISMGVLTLPASYFRRAAIPVAENNFTGGNQTRYGTPEIDDLIDRYTQTIPFEPRMAPLRELVHEQTDQVLMLPLFFQGAAYVLGSTRLRNVLPGQVWNVHLWDLA
jgi:ABC-type transport system substrate-binding protein